MCEDSMFTLGCSPGYFTGVYVIVRARANRFELLKLDLRHMQFLRKHSPRDLILDF